MANGSLLKVVPFTKGEPTDRLSYKVLHQQAMVSIQMEVVLIVTVTIVPL